jgi:formylglycine-generating enzyme required for sulfatase activity
MPSRFLSSPIGVLLLALAVLASCSSFAHAADGPGLFDSLGKLLNPAVTAPAAGNRTLTATPISQGRRIALVIGNGDYQHADNLPKLPNPAHDAEDIAEALRGFGFEVIERKNQTLEAMGDTIAEFGSKIGGSEAALFYFAGHGIQVNNQNYLMPVNARIASEASVPYQGINVNQILDEMDKAKSAANIVMLDACRNNPISGKFRSGKSRGLASPGIVPRGTVIVYATDPGNTAADGDGRNGLFTAGLLTAFKGKELSLDDVLTVASAEVERGSGNTQTPYVNGPQTLKKNFHFRTTAGQGTQVAQLGPGIGGRSRTPEQIEDELWDAIKDGGKASIFEEYMKQYPNGRYLTQARVKLAGLREPVKPPAPLAVPPAPTSSTASADLETQFWNEVKASSAKEYIDAYLKQYPKGKYIALAKIQLKKLDERDKAQRAKEAAEKQQATENERHEAQRAEQTAWEEAKADTSAAGYASYLERYPKGSYAALAQVAQSKLQRQATEREAREVTAAQRQQAEIKQREDAELRPGTVLKDCTDCPEMVVISTGVFEMGEVGSTHQVALKRFAIGKTEVTQRQWRAVMGNESSQLAFKGCDDCPVERVGWDDVQEFIRTLNQNTGKTYRLPSESEWEYACRAGGTHTYCGDERIENVAWYGHNSGGKTRPVARKQANAWGLYDMSGNVWEWTEDCWNSNYEGAPSDGSPWKSGDCSRRTLRGGSWVNGPQFARSDRRHWNDTSSRDGSNGFRLARVLP